MSIYLSIYRTCGHILIMAQLCVVSQLTTCLPTVLSRCCSRTLVTSRTEHNRLVQDRSGARTRMVLALTKNTKSLHPPTLLLPTIPPTIKVVVPVHGSGSSARGSIASLHYCRLLSSIFSGVEQIPVYGYWRQTVLCLRNVYVCTLTKLNEGLGVDVYTGESRGSVSYMYKRKRIFVINSKMDTQLP